MRIAMPVAYAPPPPDTHSVTHVVQRNETMTSIATQYKVPVAALQKANPQVVNPDVIYPGQSIQVPIPDHHETTATADASASVTAGGGQSPALGLTGTGKVTSTTKTGTDANGTTSTRSGQVSVGSDGSTTVGGSGGKTTTSTNAAGTKSTTDTHGSGSVTVDPNSGSISLSAGTGFSKEITNSKGRGVSFGVDANATVVTGKQTKGGVTTYNASTDTSISLNAGVKSKQAGLSVGYTKGIKSSFEVSMPEKAAKSTDLATVSPFDPASMPTGTTIKIDGSKYTTTEFEATFKNIANKYTKTDASGTSLLVEKTGANTVRVTAGPTKAIDVYNGVGVDFGVASAMLGRDDSLDGATLKTAQFDLSTPQGKQAFNDFAANGNMPANNGAGISNVQTIQKLDYASQSKLDVKLGPVSFGLDGAKNTGSSVLVTEPDGSATRTVNLQYSGNVPMTLTQKFNANGKEIMADRRYTYTIKADDNVAQLLNAAQTGDRQQAKSGPVHAGQTVVLSYTQGQMRDLMDDAQSAVKGNPMLHDLSALTQDYNQKFVNDPEKFAIGLARNLNGSDFGSANRLYTIATWASSQNGRPQGMTALPGTVSVVKQPA